MDGYPAGCTQATHDAAHRDSNVNAIRAVIEDRADDEIRDGAARVIEWLAEYADSSDLQRYVGLHMRGDPGGYLPALRDQLRADYTEYRMGLAETTGEWDDIERGLDEDARAEYAEGM